MNSWLNRLVFAASIIIGLTWSVAAESQFTETYFRFRIQSREEIKTLTRIISIDNVADNIVYAYANQTEFEALQQLGYEVEILPHPGTLIIPEMTADPGKARAWDVYPTYDAYVAMMNQFANANPSICKLVVIGTTVQGRQLLAVKISDNVNQEEDEPEFFYTSSMHGDETTGYVLMLRLIEYLLDNYGTSTRITQMVNNAEIWINPLANPDGTYYGGNSSVYGARRYNANGVDLNRNFPDPQDGDHPDGNSWQTETIAMMNFASQHSFIHSANFHGGTEVVNYPWDTWSPRHPDDAWYQVISHEYADTAQAHSPSNYMNGYNDGITNGYDWYQVNGGRQDYMNYWHGCRETTIEISDTKLLPANQLPAHWDYNYRSFLNYIENIFQGIRGVVTDQFGLPVPATVTLVGHDHTNSHVYTDPEVGDYHRMCLPGNYTVQFEAPGFYPQTISNVIVTNSPATLLNVQLAPLPNTPAVVFESHDARQVDPGEDAAFRITARNIGIATAYNVYGQITTSDPYITVLAASNSFPNIAPNNTAVSNADFRIRVAAQCPTNYYAEFTLFLSCTGYDTLQTFSIPVGVSQVLVFDLDRNHNSGPVIQSSLQNLRQEVVYSSADLPSDLGLFAAVFVCLGVYNQNTVLTEQLATPLAEYLTSGGRIYMEGGETWCYNTPTTLHSYFGIGQAGDGSSDTQQISGYDTTFTAGLNFTYQGDNSYMDRLTAINGAWPVFRNLSPQYINGVARSTNGYRTIGVSFEFGGIPAALRDMVMARYLTFFGIDTSSGGGQTCTPGDINQDGNINVADIVKIVSFILETSEPTEYETCAADWNEDGMINVQDIVGVVQYILNGKIIRPDRLQVLEAFSRERNFRE